MNTRKKVLIFSAGLMVFALAFAAPAAPPSWAPAYGLRSATYHYVYRYYPAAEVYFDTTRNLYFYRVNGQWEQATTLSADFQQNLKEFVTIDMDTETPYDLHQDIAAVYTAPVAGTVAEVRTLSEARKIVEVPREELAAQLPEAQLPEAQLPEAQPDVYHYQYYPDADVYRDSTRNLYFYRINLEWFQAPTLPPDIDRLLAEFVQITLRTNNPVEFNQSVVRIYPPFQAASGQAEIFASRQYLYYPDVDVYFDSDRELYFYSANDQWVKAPTLPETLRSRLTEFVMLTLKTETPYEFQDAVSALYPPARAARLIEQDVPVQPEPPAQPDQNVIYVYYYDQSVYFDPARALYFYLSDGDWQQAATLPGSITINLEEFVNVELNTLTPYADHQIVLTQHPPRKIGEPKGVKRDTPGEDKKDHKPEKKPKKDKKN